MSDFDYEKYLAKRDARRRQTAHRKPPQLPYRAGFCSWCGEVIKPKLKKDGTPRAVQASWHPDCAAEYREAASSKPFYRVLVERDGRRCKCCGADDRMTDFAVDHVKPLWSVKALPVDERRHYFLPGNLQLLCYPCHDKKTAAEATQRAEGKSGQKRLFSEAA